MLGVLGDVLLQAVAAEFAVEVTVLLMLMGAGGLEEEEEDVGATPLAQRAWAVLGATLGRALKLVSLSASQVSLWGANTPAATPEWFQKEEPAVHK